MMHVSRLSNALWIVVNDLVEWLLPINLDRRNPLCSLADLSLFVLSSLRVHIYVEASWELVHACCVLSDENTNALLLACEQTPAIVPNLNFRSAPN